MLAPASLDPGQHWLVFTLVCADLMMGDIIMLTCASLTSGAVESLFRFIGTSSSVTCLLQLLALCLWTPIFHTGKLPQL